MVDVQKYLEQFGYLDDKKGGRQHDESSRKNAIEWVALAKVINTLIFTICSHKWKVADISWGPCNLGYIVSFWVSSILIKSRRI